MAKQRFKIGERYTIIDNEGIEFPVGSLVKIIDFAFSNLAEVQSKNDRGKLVSTLVRLSQLTEYNKYHDIPKDVVDIVESFPGMLDTTQVNLAKRIHKLLQDEYKKGLEDGTINKI